MTPARVDQLVAGFARGDAISREARCLRDVLHGLGYEGGIYAPADRIASDTGDCLPLDEYRSGTDGCVICHVAIDSETREVFLSAAGRRIVRYHNITPARFFRAYDEQVARLLERARAGLGQTVAGADAVWADSEFNAAELRALGIEDVQVMPLFFGPDDCAVEPCSRMLSRLDGGLTNILSVGRLAPNKCLEELIVAFAWYHRCRNPRSRLVLAGSDRSCPGYAAMLRMLSDRLGLANVHFAGFVSEAELSACYARARVLVSVSRHEGYCLPLVEAMARGVPVIARDSGGMRETLAKGGILFDDADPRGLAELIHRAVTDEPLRRAVLDAQDRRWEDFRQRDLRRDCIRLIDGQTP